MQLERVQPVALAQGSVHSGRNGAWTVPSVFPTAQKPVRCTGQNLVLVISGGLPLFLWLYFYCMWIQTLTDRRIWSTVYNDMYSQHKPMIILPHSTANCFLGNKKALSAPKEQLHRTLWMYIKNNTQNSSQSKLVYWHDGSSEDGRLRETWVFCALNSHQGN